MTRLATDTFWLAIRSLREAARQPAIEFGNLFIPIFFFAVTVGAIGNVASRGFGVDNYLAFQLPVAILQGVAGAAGTSGMAIVTDIERGYFDKLLLTPAPRLALVLGRLMADAVRLTVLAAIILIAGLVTGSGMDAGPGGVVIVLVMSALFGLAYSSLGVAIALKTGSAQAAQMSFLLFFPLLFLSPAFAPKEVFAPWLEFLATINPVTYIVEGQRDLVSEGGWDAGSLAACFGSIFGLGAFTLSLVLWGLRSRVA
jgi:ABC-2 type transport system permease protein